MDASDRSLVRKFVYVVTALALLMAWLIGAVPGWYERSLRVKAEAEVAQLTEDKATFQAIAEVREQLFQSDERELTTIAWCLSESPDPLGCIRWTVQAFDVP